MSVEFLNDFRQRLANGRGKSGGYPADFSYAVRRDADGRVVLVLDAGQGKREGKFWRRPDVWGLAILDELMGEFPCGESEPAPAFGLELHVDRPEGVNERAKYEALRRRVAYLAEVNPGLDIRFFSNGGRLALDGSPGSDEMVREDYRARDDKGKPGRLEKDLQSFLFGKGLFDDAAPAAGASPSVARGNIRLSLLGDDFAFGAKAKGNLMREFPTGAFRTVKSRDSRVLPTWFIDFLTVNRNGDLAIIEMKFIDVGAAALEDAAQILDYALYFRHYRSELAKHLATHGIVWKEDVKKICAYLVSNAFHSRMERLWAYYNRRPDLLHLKRIGMGYAIQQ